MLILHFRELDKKCILIIICKKQVIFSTNCIKFPAVYLTILRGTEIWRIENFQPVPLPKSDYGKFYSGDTYIILQTTSGKGGAYLYDIHFWIGKESSQVPFARSSLNHDDVFILDTEKKIYQFNGANSNIQERAKALEVVQYLKDTYHEGKCDVAIIDDGNLQAESDSGEFWVLFGGFAPIGKKIISEDDVVLETTPSRLYSIVDGQLKLEEGTLSKAMLENNKCYLLDCGAEIFIWVGRVTQVDERKAASKVAEDFIISQNRPKTTRITQVIQGYETHSYKSNFESWPVGTATGTSGGEEGRGKVAALLKQQGIDIKGLSKGSPLNDEVPPLLEGGGKLEVWCINSSAKSPVPKEEIGKFYSGDCYIVLYTYHSGEKKEDYFLTCWMGNDSIQVNSYNQDDQMMASQLANTMWSSLKERPVQGCIFQGKEPPQFIALFQPMVVLKVSIP
ncbi:Villin headpiece domain [Musa troglodytarum]|uniref:Villin headpiece domain n=1 Tax=Musa troglodytarum TaxID=320322 RepID=A0A9E7L407_9LILI|nr:Villin headpiece domain [Musa troglodytarum]